MPVNGYLTDAELAPIDNGQRLRPDAAKRYMALRAHAARDGWNIITTEGYRDYATQVYLRNLYLYGNGNPAGIPGTSSHGWGLAVDINTYSWQSPIFLWMSRNAGAYGFNNNQGRADGEHWHWVYDGSGAAGHTAELIEEEKEEDMSATQYFYCTDNDALAYLVGTGDWWARENATAPLYRLTNAQAQAAFEADGLSSGPFAFPNVKGKPGKWFIEALKDDIIVSTINKQAHARALQDVPAQYRP